MTKFLLVLPLIQASHLIMRAFSLFVLFTLLSCGGGGKDDIAIPPTPVTQAPPVNIICTMSCDKPIRINEAVSSNSVFDDEDGDSEDWFELLNVSDIAVPLENWTITDSIDEPTQWSMPSLSLNAGEYLRIWASDKDRTSTKQSLHTNFKISSKGETLYLFDDTGTLIHQLVVEGLKTGTSTGIAAQSDNTVYFETPTPGLVNASTEYAGISLATISSSHLGGAISPQSIVLTKESEQQVIRYTLDGSVPNENSIQYTQALFIDVTSVLRARVFESNYVPSKTQSFTFFVDEIHDIAIVSLITDPDNFFDNDTGIYVLGDTYESAQPNFGANFWEDWERDIHFSFYQANGTLALSFDAGVKIFGGWSRANEQRSLSIFARGRYGTDEIDYPLFPQLDYDKFQSIVLRNSGNDWLRTMLRDVTLTSLMDGSGLETQAHRPVAVYLNKEYWGMYNLREKVNEHFLASKKGVNANDIDLLEKSGIEPGELIEGSNLDYIDLTNYLNNNSLESTENYNYVADRIDIENYIIYQIAQIYFSNTDWPGNNIKFWKSSDTKWRWILFDTDFGFSIYGANYANNALKAALATSGPDWPNPPWSTLLFRKLIQNESFKNQFINRFTDELNSRFVASAVITHIDQTAAKIANEIPLQFERWEQYAEGRTWQNEIQTMKTFASNRVDFMMDDLSDEFDLGDIHTLTIQNTAPKNGHVKVNSLDIKLESWEGDYFSALPVTLIAQPAIGFVFSHWEGGSTSTTAQIQLTLSEHITINAVFVAE